MMWNLPISIDLSFSETEEWDNILAGFQIIQCCIRDVQIWLILNIMALAVFNFIKKCMERSVRSRSVGI